VDTPAGQARRAGFHEELALGITGLGEWWSLAVLSTFLGGWAMQEGTGGT
jgi:hypothetical protein